MKQIDSVFFIQQTYPLFIKYSNKLTVYSVFKQIVYLILYSYKLIFYSLLKQGGPVCTIEIMSTLKSLLVSGSLYGILQLVSSPLVVSALSLQFTHYVWL